MSPLQPAKPAFRSRIWIYLVRLKTVLSGFHRILRIGLQDGNTLLGVSENSVMNILGGCVSHQACTSVSREYCMVSTFHPNSGGSGSQADAGSVRQQVTPGCACKRSFLLLHLWLPWVLTVPGSGTWSKGPRPPHQFQSLGKGFNGPIHPSPILPGGHGTQVLSCSSHLADNRA